MKLLLKVKNGTPPQRKSALRQLTGECRLGWRERKPKFTPSLSGLWSGGLPHNLCNPRLRLCCLCCCDRVSGVTHAHAATAFLPSLPADKARDFGAGPLFNQILPLLMSPTLEDQERHLLVKVGPPCAASVCWPFWVSRCMHVFLRCVMALPHPSLGHHTPLQLLSCPLWPVLALPPITHPFSPPALFLAFLPARSLTASCSSWMSWCAPTATRSWW